MDPEKFLMLAEELVERRTPCDSRTAIGRAYYGVFNATAQLMESNGVPPPGGSTAHQKLWQDLLNSGVEALSVPGSQLSDLHGMRRKADYDMDDEDPEDYETAKFWVKEARQHIETIKLVFTGSSRAAAAGGIMEYRKKVGR
jgi:uncharacterized protein (UPF0332 family)